MKKLVTALCAAMLSLAARAETSPLQFDRNVCSLDAVGALTLQTLPTPKGWFWQSSFDRTKTDLRTTYTLSTSTCDLGAGSATLSSTALGTFVQAPLMNANGKQEIGYIWNMIGDLSANQNHWWYLVGCDGAKVKVGCDQPRDATFTITAYETKSGQCRTYVNAAGVTTCAADTVAFQLASIQDPDQVIDPALCQPVDPTCGGIGQCVSDRNQNGGYCDTQFPVVMAVDPKNSKRTYDANEKARSDCKTASSCYCKAQLPLACQNDGNDCKP